VSDLWSRRLRALPWAPPGRYPHLTYGDAVALDVRRHPVTLMLPLVRTLLGILVLALGSPGPTLFVLFALSVVGWTRMRLPHDLRTSVAVVTLTTLVLLVADGGATGAVVAVGLLLWLADDVADWYTDRLVVTRKRVYRLYGVFTTHSPSIALTSVTFIDPLEPLLGRLFGYGTILLDSAAQRDEPLSRFDHLPAADFVHVKILELRTEATSKAPQAPDVT